MRKPWLWLLAALVVIAGSVWLWRSLVVHWLEPRPGQADPEERSTDLASDLRLMRETKALNEPGMRGSTTGPSTPPPASSTRSNSSARPVTRRWTCSATRGR
ncbi:MAG: hypothetical protein K2W96_09905 [Gemmataceae bacterium]|nr:hypothetical protein [Gemmataceae bacterium]